MPMGSRTVPIGWEYEVPVEEILAARHDLRAELEAYFHADAASLTDLDIARFMVRHAHGTGRYLSPALGSLGF